MRNDHTEKSLRDEIEKSERSLKIFNDTKKALQTEERFVNFFKGYNQSSVESFITSYAQQKAFWYSYSDSVAKNKMHERSIYRNNAVNALKEIYVKKLFDLKCRWVAGEMDLPGVETSHNFHRLEKKPELGTAIKPITEEEVNCYIAFLDYKKENPEKDYDDPGTNLALHFYHQHKSTALEDFGDEEYIPVWFMFYDRRFGTDELLKLPTTRVDMECDLHDIWLEHIFPKTLTEEQLKTVTPHLNRTKRMELKQDKQKREAYFAEQNRQYEEQKKNSPKYEHMSTYDRKKMKTLVALIETPEVQKYYRAYREWHDRGNRNELIESNIIYMRKVKEWIPVPSHTDYREAIKEAYENYKEKMLREILPVVHAEYLESVIMKKPFNWKTNDYDSPFDGDSEMNKRLLAALEWKGEPQNFDFLKKENLPHDRT